mmetsp:Transcript_112757/g.319414  ORF Transcript_112757/g.319414 Transcript_112757/m.319414 type:complete len:203 (+) Transcript_112757:165-773(+)
MSSVASFVLPWENSSQLSPMPSIRSPSALKYLASCWNTIAQLLKAVVIMVLMALMRLSVSPVVRKWMMSSVMSVAFPNDWSHTSFATLILSDSCSASGTIFMTILQSFDSMVWRPSSMSRCSCVKTWVHAVTAFSPSARTSASIRGSMWAATVPLGCPWPFHWRERPAPPCRRSAAEETTRKRTAHSMPAAGFRSRRRRGSS